MARPITAYEVTVNTLNPDIVRIAGWSVSAIAANTAVSFHDGGAEGACVGVVGLPVAGSSDTRFAVPGEIVVASGTYVKLIQGTAYKIILYGG
jgi:hypothetical protein